MKKAVVYSITMPDGKKYIGVTSRKMDTRIAEHKCHMATKNNKLYRAMRKFNFEDISFRVIDSVDYNLAFKAEKFYIKAFDTHKNGLNDSDGGQGANGKKHTKKSVKMRTKSRLKKKPYFFVENKRKNICHGLWDNQLECSKSLGIDHSYLSKLVKGKRTSPTWKVTAMEVDYLSQ